MDADPEKDRPEKLPGIDKCFKATRDALELARNIPAKDRVPPCQYWTAHVQRISMEFDAAIRTATEAMDGYRAMRDKVGEEHCVLLMAMTQQYAPNLHAEAEGTANRAMEMFREVDEQKGVESCEKFIRELKGGPAPKVQEAAASESAVAAGPKGPDPVVVRGRVKETVRQLLGSDEDFEDDNPLMEGGLDSLSAVQFRNDLVKEFAVNLPASMTFDYPTIQQLAAHIVEISSA